MNEVRAHEEGGGGADILCNDMQAEAVYLSVNLVTYQNGCILLPICFVCIVITCDSNYQIFPITVEKNCVREPTLKKVVTRDDFACKVFPKVNPWSSVILPLHEITI